jgi:hypothetical protein
LVETLGEFVRVEIVGFHHIPTPNSVQAGMARKISDLHRIAP